MSSGRDERAPSSETSRERPPVTLIQPCRSIFAVMAPPPLGPRLSGTKDACKMVPVAVNVCLNIRWHTASGFSHSETLGISVINTRAP